MENRCLLPERPFDGQGLDRHSRVWNAFGKRLGHVGLNQQTQKSFSTTAAP